ncbi:sulfatase family protein [Labilibacter marinus]|uniref:sulfatase family protein n=1 Tax=Labilibacter marinus TaxID=1477105 RepID=UPI00083018E9|nr:arylsulfatase [Labilibacter marinus]
MIQKTLLLSLVTILLISCSTAPKKEKSKPNIVIIYADDMGYGDLNCQNPNSKIPTPHLDKLASEGMRFTDAHSSSGICTPSRFALLTGQYHWRRGHGIVNSFGQPYFKDNDITLPQILKDAGYSTACIGKWHLGWNWEFNNKPSGEVMQWNKLRQYYLPKDVKLTGTITGGPLDRGFDYYFGDGTINFPPYAWVENDKIIEIPTEVMTPDVGNKQTKEGSWEFRPGPMVKDWEPYDVLPTLTKKTVSWIKRQKKDQPFFLYFALPSPHAPIIPNKEFIGKSEAGGYGDFMFQTDWVAGQVLEALKEKGFEDNTIVIFSADNGPEKYAWARAENYGHYSMGDFRGLKRDVWEGGHHIPFIFKWPGQIEAGSVSDEVISQVDIMATLASITQSELSQNAAPDSYNLVPLLKGKKYTSPLREATVQNTYKNHYGLRKGKWFYINKPTGEVSKMSDSFKALRNYPITKYDTKGLLFDLENDPEQRTNLYNEYPKIVEEMDALLNKYREQGYSVKR